MQHTLSQGGVGRSPALLALFALVTPALAYQQLSPPLVLPGDGLVGPAAGPQSQARVARGASGFLSVWQDGRSVLSGAVQAPDGLNPNMDIHAVLLDAQGRPAGDPLIVNQSPFSQLEPDVAWNGTHYLVVWRSTRLTTFWKTDGIYAARVTEAGEVLDDPPIVIDDSDDYDERYPLVASDGSNWMVLWSDYDGGTSEFIAGALVDSSGLVLAKQTVHVPSPNTQMPHNYALDHAADRYLFVYERGWGGAPTGFFIDHALNKIGTPFTMSSASCYEPDVGASASGFFVAWGADKVRGTPVALDGTVAIPGGADISLGAPFWSSSSKPAVGSDGSAWSVAWEAFDFTNGQSLHASQVSTGGSVLPGSPFPLVPSGDFLDRPAMCSGPGFAQLVWIDGRNSPANSLELDVYGTKLLPAGQSGPQLAVSVSRPAQVLPELAGDREHGYLAVFRSESGGVRRILAQRLDGRGMPIEAEPQLVASGDNWIGGHDVAWNGSEWLIAWELRQNGGSLLTARVLARRMLANGSLLDAVPIDVVDGNAPSVAALGSQFLIVASDEPQNHIRFIRAQRVEGTDGSLVGPRLTLSSSYSQAPDVAGLADRWLVAWHQRATHDSPGASIRGAVVLANGNALPAFSVENAQGTAQTSPAVTRSDERAFIAWCDGADVRLRALALDGSPLGQDTGFTVCAANGLQFAPAIGWDGERLLTAFHDYRNDPAIQPGVGDVWASRVSEDGTVLDHPLGFTLANHPLAAECNPAVAGGGGLAVSAHAAIRTEAPYRTWRIVLRTLDDPQVGQRFCFGNGYGTDCPCGNASESGGCANGTGVGGLLSASGSASIGADDLVLVGSGLVPGQAALLFQGTSALGGGNGLVFGDGLRCVGGAIVRLAIRVPNAGGNAHWGPGLAASGGWVAGSTRYLQVWYRDPAGSPCGAFFNLSNGLAVTFEP